MRSGRKAPQPTTWDRRFIAWRLQRRLRGRRRLAETSEFVADLVEKAVDLHVHGHADRVGEAESVSRAMAFNSDAAQTQKNRAVIAPRIAAHSQFFERAASEQIADPCWERVTECRFEEFGEKLGRAFSSFESDIAGEAVGDDNVYRPGRDVVSLDEAVEVNWADRLAQSSRGLADGIVSLEILRAHIEQTDRRFNQPEHRTCGYIAHQCELY